MKRLAIAFLALLLPSAAAPPRVLILGDSIYMQPSQQAANLLKGIVEIVRPNNPEAFNTTTALASLDELLGDGKWDLIHFNYGLGDLVHRAPGMKSFRVMPRKAGGIPATGPAEYEAKLTAIVERLKSTRAKLVWASTTPIRGGSNGLYEPGSEVAYNAIAAKVMAAHSIPVNDMHASVSAMLDKEKQAAPADPYSLGKNVSIHPPLVRAICLSLALPIPPGADTRPEPLGRR
ncbi:SGNH/GDSL hydrolase family protein [Akkermansiaceae bacterium]|nr:SGNH/GDSL hydrolase family protein [Akkermansiaceae bacterium]